MSTAVVELPKRESVYSPVLSIEQARGRFAQMADFVRSVMRPGTDYGAIPGAGTKPVLLKPGAEKLCTLFGLTIPDPVISAEVEDWAGEKYGGEPFFYYRVMQRLMRDGTVIASQFGSCNSRESKYRWRQGERKCPNCGQPAIIKGKAEYGGGYICFGKKGGCGAKFREGDPAIEGQSVGRVPNPDIADLVNTIQKMAEKRALIAATLLAVNASEFFTQDLDDLADSEAIQAVPIEVVAAEPARQRNGKTAQQTAQSHQLPAPTPSREQQIEQVIPTAPPKPGAMFVKLQEKESTLVAEGLCREGELIEHLRAAGNEAGYIELELWSGPQLREFAAEQVKVFEDGARAAKAAETKKAAKGKVTPAPAPAATEEPAPAKGINEAQVSMLAGMCGARGVHWRDVCKALKYPAKTDIATIAPAQWQAAVNHLMTLPELKPQAEAQEELAEGEVPVEA